MTFSVTRQGSLDALLAPLSRMENGGALQAGCYAVNHTVAKAETSVKRALMSQTGLRSADIGKELKRYSASLGRPEASIKSDGPYHRLSEFAARQTTGGVSAAPWGERRVFPHTFFVPAYGGGVFRRQGKSRFPVEQLWGPAIPKEMVKDASLDAFDRVVAVDLPARMAHEWRRLMGG